MNDYIIAVDRDGQPYIAHAWGRGANGQHKYIAKIGEGAKARYFYTQEQLRAFQQGARQGAQNAANKAKEKASDAVGRARENSVLLNVGNQYRAAKGAYQNSKSSDPQTAKWGKKGYDDNNTLGGKVYKAQQKVVEKAKDIAGVDERARRDKANKELSKARGAAEAYRFLHDAQSKGKIETIYSDKLLTDIKENSEKAFLNAKMKRDNAQKGYNKTILGAAENANKVIENLKDLNRNDKTIERIERFKGRINSAKQEYEKAEKEINGLAKQYGVSINTILTSTQNDSKLQRAKDKYYEAALELDRITKELEGSIEDLRKQKK